MTADLSAFILARIDEDEAAARAATSGPWVASGGSVDGARHQPVVMGGFDSAGSLADGCMDEDARHIARHDPARVLAQCAAYRAIVAEHPAPSYIGTPGARLACKRCSDLGGPYGYDEPENWVDWPCPTLRALAGIWRDHDEWREEWA